jgi:hypothetical protein
MDALPTTWDDNAPPSPTSIAGSMADPESVAESVADSVADSENESGQVTPTQPAKSKKPKVVDIDSGTEEEEQVNKKRKKDPIQSVKNLLIKYAPLHHFDDNRQFETARYFLLNDYQGSDKKEMKAQLTIQIKQSLYMIGKSKVDTTKHRYLLAEKLIALAENMGSYTRDTEKLILNKNFYEYLKTHFNIGQR